MVQHQRVDSLFDRIDSEDLFCDSIEDRNGKFLVLYRRRCFFLLLFFFKTCRCPETNDIGADPLFFFSLLTLLLRRTIGSTRT